MEIGNGIPGLITSAEIKAAFDEKTSLKFIYQYDKQNWKITTGSGNDLQIFPHKLKSGYQDITTKMAIRLNNERDKLDLC